MMSHVVFMIVHRGDLKTSLQKPFTNLSEKSPLLNINLPLFFCQIWISNFSTIRASLAICVHERAKQIHTCRVAIPKYTLFCRCDSLYYGADVEGTDVEGAAGG